MASFHHRIKSGKKGSACAHAAYIARNGKFSNKGEDLVHTGFGNMPEWAAENPSLFWKIADRYERSNGAVYREHEVALPNELTEEQLILLTEKIVGELIGNKPYQYAIHAPDGTLGAIPNPHVHLMYSDRVPDGIKREPGKMFSRFNAKQPETGGCRKDSGGLNRQELRENVIATRKTIADLQNQTLEEHGHEARVDHRSLREQGKQRPPERHLGAARIRSLSADEKADLAASRDSQSVPGKSAVM